MENVIVSKVKEAAKKVFFFNGPSFTLPPALFVAGPLKKLHFFWLPLPLRAFVLNLLEVGGLHASVGGPNLLSDKPVHTLQTYPGDTGKICKEMHFSLQVPWVSQNSLHIFSTAPVDDICKTHTECTITAHIRL